MVVRAAPTALIQAQQEKRHRTLGERLRRNLPGYLFIAPWLFGFFVFTFGPFLYSLYLSFTDWHILGSPHWIGLSNYRAILTADPLFRITLKNTVYYGIFHVIGVNLISLALAQLLNQKLRGFPLFRTLFYLPTVTSGVATALVFSLMFNGNTGIINAFLNIFGIKGPNWLFSAQWTMPALILMSLWDIGTPMIIYLAALQNVPTGLTEAALIDGAGRWQRFRSVILPLISPAIFFNVIVGIIGAFKVFTPAKVITNGGPANHTLFYVLYLYRQAFENLRMGYASALGWLLFLIIFAFSAVQLVVSRRWVYYESGDGV
ncbi:MAG: carbohydrate ABC transporter permease [Thermomicrobiales bacterium]